MASSMARRSLPCSTSSASSAAPHRAVRTSIVLPRAAITAERATLDISKMSPMHDRVLVKPLDDEQKTAGGILLPKAAPKAPSDAHFGEVVSVGQDVKLGVAPGDVICFQKYAMAEVEVKDGNILFIAEKSILGKLTK